MILALADAPLIRGAPHVARSIDLLIAPALLPRAPSAAATDQNLCAETLGGNGDAEVEPGLLSKAVPLAPPPVCVRRISIR